MIFFTMLQTNLSNFTKWRFIGNFEPTLDNTQQFEVAVKQYKKGDQEKTHYHKISTEYTVINNGSFRMGDTVLAAWDIMCIDPLEATDFECLEDWTTTVIKIPSSKDDKYIVE